MKHSECTIYLFKVVDGYTKAHRMADVLKLYGYDDHEVCKVVVRKLGSKRYVVRFNTKL